MYFISVFIRNNSVTFDNILRESSLEAKLKQQNYKVVRIENKLRESLQKSLQK